MILCVDAGNSRLKWAAGPLTGAWHASGEWSLSETPASAMTRAWSGLDTPEAIVACVVAPAAVADALCRWCRDEWDCEPTLVRAVRRAHGVVNGYADPGRLGADRWAALVGARALARRAACVVDCGTAVTVDALDGEGRFVAGAILPGAELSRQALRHGTSGVRPLGPGSADPRVRDTDQAVAAGVLIGLAGAVDRLVESMLGIVGAPATVFLTGGDAAALAPLLRLPVERCPDLVLRGLRVIAGGTA